MVNVTGLSQGTNMLRLNNQALKVVVFGQELWWSRR